MPRAVNPRDDHADRAFPAAGRPAPAVTPDPSLLPSSGGELANDADALAREVARRRTFAIISHPDAGKTTLTEKLLLYAGAIELAGAVRGRKTSGTPSPTGWRWSSSAASRSARPRSSSSSTGITSRCSTRPGHQDFSEDTYRTLLAVDSVVMVLDAAKGIEPQTLKLFEVCRARGLPVLTFINKLDQPSRDPFELLDRDRARARHRGGADELAARRRRRFRRRLRPRGATRCCSTSAARAATAPSRSRSPIRAIRQSSA